MIRSSLRRKVLLSVGFIILVVLGTSTFVHIQELERDYLEAIEWRSEALAQGILQTVAGKQHIISNIRELYGLLSIHCKQLYESNKERNVTHVAVIDVSGAIIAHNDMTLLDTPVERAVLRDALQHRTQITILDETVYHTLVPILGTDNTYLGSVDIGVPKSFVDEKIKNILFQSGVLLGLFLVLSFLSISFLMYVLLTKPVRRLLTAGQQLAEGNLVQAFQTAGRMDEIAVLGTAFNRVANYLQNVAEVASHIATGDLAGEVRVRSKHDVLGKAIRDMLYYLQHVATVTAKIAEGDLTETVQVRSTDDAFGQAIQTMMKGLHDLIIQIRSSAEQIASTGTTILSLTDRDINIVEQVQRSAEEMTATMREMGASVEEVAHNMDTLSTSVEETSASVSQMTSSIAHIAANTNDLTDQTHQTIASLKETVASLERVVESTGVSKQLSQETIQDALRGQEAVEQVMNSMETIQHTVTTAVDAMTRFEQRSRDIDMILEVIREITEQTSLLALNASIIAAQAGMHGRGFAVVADEIRNLASGVGTSTKDIAAIVRTLQQDTSNVVHTIHEGAEDVEQGMERTQQARETLQKITTSAQQSSSVVTEIADTLHGVMTRSRTVSAAMEQVNAMTDDITSATNEQEASTRQIHQAIAQINEMASQIQQATTQQLTGVHQLLETTNNVTRLIDQNLESSQQIAHTTGDLSSQADILVHSVEQFKLEG